MIKLAQEGRELQIEANFEIGGEAAFKEIELFGQQATAELEKQVKDANANIQKLIDAGVRKPDGGFYTADDFISDTQLEALRQKVVKATDERTMKQVETEVKSRNQIVQDSLEIEEGLNDELLEQTQDKIDKERDIKIESQISLDDLSREIEANTKAQEEIAESRDDILKTANERSLNETKQILLQNMELQKKAIEDVAMLRVQEVEENRKRDIDLLKVEESNLRNSVQTEKDIIQEKVNRINVLETELAEKGLQLDDKQLAQRKKLTQQLEQLDVDLFRKIEDLDLKEVEINKNASEQIVTINEEKNDNIKENDEQFVDDSTELDERNLEQKREIYSTIKEIAITAVNAILDSQIQSVDKEIELSDHRIASNEERISEIESMEGKVNKVRARRLRQERKRVEEQNETELEGKRKLEIEKAQIERTQAVIAKGVKIAEAVTNTALAVTRVLAQTGDFTGTLAAIVAAQGALQVGIIAAEPIPEVPSFAKGGTLDGSPRKGGVFKGRSHAEGGIMVNSGAAEVEGDEIILTKGVFRNPAKRAIASALNVSEGGVPFARGGLISASMITSIPKLQAGGVNFKDTLSVSSTQNTNAIIEGITDAFTNLPAPIVGVEEFVEVQDRLNVTVQENTF
jgi:hypothetical protein